MFRGGGQSFESPPVTRDWRPRWAIILARRSKIVRDDEPAKTASFARRKPSYATSGIYGHDTAFITTMPPPRAYNIIVVRDNNDVIDTHRLYAFLAQTNS